MAGEGYKRSSSAASLRAPYTASSILEALYILNAQHYCRTTSPYSIRSSVQEMDTETLQQKLDEVKKEDAVVLLWKLFRGTVREIDPPTDEEDKNFLFHQLLTEYGDKGKKFLFFELLKKTGDTFKIPLDPVNYNDRYPWEAHIDTHGGKKWLVALSRTGMILGKDRWWTEDELHEDHKVEVQQLWREAEKAEEKEQDEQS